MSRRFDLGLFRAQTTDLFEPRLNWKPTDRWAKNVSFLVDNLWEWHRMHYFPHFPSRRHSVYAFPVKERADKYATKGKAVYRIILHGSFKMCQAPVRDSRYHADCKAISQAIQRILNEQGFLKDNGWASNATSAVKLNLGRLWVPVLTGEEVQAVADTSEVVTLLLKEVEPAIRYWHTLRFMDQNDPGLETHLSLRSLGFSDHGEVFFEPTGGGDLKRV